MEFQDCLICKKSKATKTNSHIIPSFIVAKVCSYDGSGKRDKEVMFTMTPLEEKLYLGAIPDTKIEELVDTQKLSDERIEQELSNNTASKDYIFCPECEKNLSVYLETPYAECLQKGKTPNVHLAYFFWMSIVWRMSISKQFEFSLPSDIEQTLGNALNEYFNAIKSGHNTDIIVGECNFSYRMLRAPSYLPNGMAYLGGRYYEQFGILTLTLGDTILCAKFDNPDLPEDFIYLGLEEYIKSAEINNGMEEERYSEVDNTTLEKAMHRMAMEAASIRLHHEKIFADIIWHNIGLEGPMPNEIFITFIQRLYTENVKPGDKKTPERYIQIFNETLGSFGFIPK